MPPVESSTIRSVGHTLRPKLANAKTPSSPAVVAEPVAAAAAVVAAALAHLDAAASFAAAATVGVAATVASDAQHTVVAALPGEWVFHHSRHFHNSQSKLVDPPN